MGIFDKLFGKKAQLPATARKKMPTLEEFPNLNAEDRLGMIMLLGDTGKFDFFPFLKYAIQSDPDSGVTFAALKRIHHFENHPETVQLLTELENTGAGNKFEPYFSMALSRLGLITMEEFEEKINSIT